MRNLLKWAKHQSHTKGTASLINIPFEGARESNSMNSERMKRAKEKTWNVRQAQFGKAI